MPPEWPKSSLYVDPDYQTALVGYPGRGYGWVFARTPTIDEATYQSLLNRLRDQGYDISQFRRVPQTPQQVGNPGFQ
jgi:apolipoprotein D and lipocalin family protein